MTPQRNDVRLGIALMVGSALVFAMQDGLSRHLAETYNVFTVVMLRYWFFAAFGIWLAARQPGGLRAALGTAHPVLQIGRGLILVTQICTMVAAFTILGIVASGAVFISYPLLVAALSGPILGEKVGWRRWAAIAVGFAGVIVILDPGTAVARPAALIPLIGATLFAVYSLLTRFAARTDSTATSFFWVGTVGAVALTPPGLWLWEPMTLPDMALMACLMATGVTGHWLLIKCYEVAEAGAVQPFAYFHLAFVAVIGAVILHETIALNVIAGAVIVVGAGLFTLWREQVRRRDTARSGGT